MKALAPLLLILALLSSFPSVGQNTLTLTAEGPTKLPVGGSVVLRADIGYGFNTTLTGDYPTSSPNVDVVTFSAFSNTQLSFKSPLPTADPGPFTMLLFLNGTQIGQVDSAPGAAGQPCSVTIDGTTYYTTFQESDRVDLEKMPRRQFQFARNGEALSAPQSETYTATKAGTYTVTGTSGTGAALTSNAVVVTATPLPVTLTAFTATASASSIVLAWSTSIEEGNKGFGVERSLNGTDWQPLAFITGKGSNSAYTYADLTATPGQALYYRLRQEDTDGGVAYSDVRVAQVVLSAKSATTLAGDVYPNPFTGQLTIQGIRSEAVVTLFDGTGRPVLRQTLRAQQSQLTGLERLPQGVYLLRVQQGTSTRQIRVVRQ